MKQFYLLALGSNEQAETRLVAMVEALVAEFGPLWLSPICRTKAVGHATHDYLNAVVSFSSQRCLDSVKTSCKQIETNLGRVRPSPWCAADIDILTSWHGEAPIQLDSFVQEDYLRPLVASLFAAMGNALNDSAVEHSASSWTNIVPLALHSGVVVGSSSLQLPH